MFLGYVRHLARRRDPNEFIEMYGAVKKCLTLLVAQTYGEAEMGTMQAKLVRYIGRHTRISQAELARATGSDPTLTGRALQTLIERGLVRRERSDEDRREYVLELSAAGRRLQDRIEQLRVELAARIVSVLDERDLDDFDRIGKKLVAAFDPPADKT